MIDVLQDSDQFYIWLLWLVLNELNVRTQKFEKNKKKEANLFKVSILSWITSKSPL